MWMHDNQTQKVAVDPTSVKYWLFIAQADIQVISRNILFAIAFGINNVGGTHWESFLIYFGKPKPLALLKACCTVFMRTKQLCLCPNWPGRNMNVAASTESQFMNYGSVGVWSEHATWLFSYFSGFLRAVAGSSNCKHRAEMSTMSFCYKPLIPTQKWEPILRFNSVLLN